MKTTKTKPRSLYVNQKTGGIVSATNSGAKKLPADYKKVKFVKNERGKQVARVKIDGATIDISERETVEAPTNGNPTAE